VAGAQLFVAELDVIDRASILDRNARWVIFCGDVCA